MPDAPLPQETLHGIRANAEMAVEEFRKLEGAHFGLDAASVTWVDGYIERMRVRTEAIDGLTSVLGSYLGEAIVAATDGRWAKHENGDIGILFGSDDWCFPFAKVAKQFANGAEDSIASFYGVSVNFVAKGKLRSAAGGPS